MTVSDRADSVVVTDADKGGEDILRGRSDRARQEEHDPVGFCGSLGRQSREEGNEVGARGGSGGCEVDDGGPGDGRGGGREGRREAEQLGIGMAIAAGILAGCGIGFGIAVAVAVGEYGTWL